MYLCLMGCVYGECGGGRPLSHPHPKARCQDAWHESERPQILPQLLHPTSVTIRQNTPARSLSLSTHIHTHLQREGGA